MVRPRLKPALRRVQRDAGTLQIGVHPRRAVMLSDLVPEVRELVERLDGTRNLAQVLDNAEAKGFGKEQMETLVALLDARGLLDDAATSPEPLRPLTLAERDRLRPELDAVSLRAGVRDGGMAVLAGRREAHVRIYGAGRVGAQVAALLAASGVGNICVVDPQAARRLDVVPGGLDWSEVGSPRHEGAVAVARRIAPGVNAWSGARAAHLRDGAVAPDLAVLAPVSPLDALLVDDLLERRIPHLLTSAYEGYGSVGPLVLPGRTACIHCMELTRRDRDPTWPIVAARLGGFPPGEIACDAVLSTLVAAEATGHALAFLDGRPPIVTNSTVDVLPDWRWGQRRWDRHPQCPCTEISASR
ncbi:ThiF family adenylyltransferase [Sinosporangium album]|uniref:ThiF family adenylyltransferase n=1 Tax=Sinosporangium album TaxID=504805 RepID=UPI001FDEE56C|nr:ThiF family adenylyltransferase [Sinosporangium album]